MVCSVFMDVINLTILTNGQLTIKPCALWDYFIVLTYIFEGIIVKAALC